MVELWDLFDEYPEVEDKLEEWRERVETGSHMDLEADLKPWMGPEISFGLLGLDRYGEPVVAATFSVRDSEKARDFVARQVRDRENDDGYDFEYRKADGASIWTDEHLGEAYGLTDDILVLVFGDETGESVEELLALGDDEDGRSLANDDEFQAAQGQLRDPRLASGFVNVRRLLRLVESGGLNGYSNLSVLGDDPNIPDWAAISVSSFGRGIVAEIVVPDESSYLEGAAKLPSVDNVAELLPADTVGFLAVAFETEMDEWRRQLEELEYDGGEYQVPVREVYQELYVLIEGEGQRPPREVEDPDLADVLDLVLELAEVYTGVDPEKGFFDLLSGVLVVGVEEFDLSRVEEDPERETVNAVAMLSYKPTKEEILVDTMEELSDFVERTVPVDVDSVNIGVQNRAQIFYPDMRELETEYSPGYVFHDGYLVFGTTEEALENVVSAQKGREVKLSDTDLYRRAAAVLPGDLHALAWVNMGELVGQVERDTVDLTVGELEVLEESVGSVAVGVSTDGEYARISVVLTLFAE